MQMTTDKLNSSLEKLAQWSNEYYLAINGIKTKFLITGSKRMYNCHQINHITIIGRRMYRTGRKTSPPRNLSRLALRLVQSFESSPLAVTENYHKNGNKM